MGRICLLFLILLFCGVLFVRSNNTEEEVFVEIEIQYSEWWEDDTQENTWHALIGEGADQLHVMLTYVGGVPYFNAERDCFGLEIKTEMWTWFASDTKAHMTDCAGTKSSIPKPILIEELLAPFPKEKGLPKPVYRCEESDCSHTRAV